jgi:hypothetical protein
LAQAVVLFGQGVFGNKVAELINISPNSILLLSILSILVSLPISIILASQSPGTSAMHQAGVAVVQTPPAPISTPSNLVSLLLSRVITVFPTAGFIGTIVSLLSITILPKRLVLCMIPTNRLGVVGNPCLSVYDYEILTFFLVVTSQDIVNCFERSSYFVEVSGHREPS